MYILFTNALISLKKKLTRIYEIIFSVPGRGNNNDHVTSETHISRRYFIRAYILHYLDRS